ncbi:MAG TPA: trypsin-like peptidase domain-containing protein, partial [Methylomirabilota bacterium]|nr:trypsin-like peptidase domain-containing protein [Methylomirabilota bacterium]
MVENKSTTVKEEKTLTSGIVERGERSNMSLISLVILLSFLFGIAGSVFGSMYLTKPGQPLSGSSGEVKTLQVNEESAVVDVVKRASPAVVSIIISKDLNKLPGYSSTPFNLGPFGLDPFFNSGNSSSNSTQPNIQEVGAGSGFIISSDGLIATNKHVVDNTSATYTVLTNDGKKYDATVLSRDPVNDLALVKIQASNLPTLSLGNSTDIEIGQKVIAIGNSLGQYHNTVTTGVVSGIGRTITASGTDAGAEQLEGVIQTDAAINPGNSGGP